MVKQVLIVAFYFPPLAGGGVQRPLKFVKYLPDYNWQPIVLTINPNDIKSYVKDESLLDEIPSDVRIHRTFYPDLTRFPLFRGSAAKLFFEPFKNHFLIPSNEVTWNHFAFRKAVRIIESHRPQAILTTSPPNSVHLIGLKLSRKFSIPWVMDMRDEWVHPHSSKDFMNLPTKRRRRERQLESKCLKTADKITVVNSMKKDALITDNALYPEKVGVITNGYDEQDYIDYHHQFPPKGNKFKILLMGSLTLQRVGANLVRCVEELLDSNQIDEDKIEIRILTPSNPKHISKYLNKRSSTVFRFHNHLPHAEAIRMMSENHAFLLLVSEENKPVVPGKIFEYIRGARLVIGFVPEDGEAARIIDSTSAGEYCSPNNIGKMKSLILKYYSCWEKDKLPYSPDKNEIRKYERKILTGKLSEVLNGITRD
ncbi:MAG: hypothetical protein GF315_06355 [candidate division Zixibacteria bacterium]|nr:hypothetical protein [candidate division Zixibacteria bacterium]